MCTISSHTFCSFVCSSRPAPACGQMLPDEAMGSLLSGAPCKVLSVPCSLHPRCLCPLVCFACQTPKAFCSVLSKGEARSLYQEANISFPARQDPCSTYRENEELKQFFKKSPSRLLKLDASLWRRSVGRNAFSVPLSKHMGTVVWTENSGGTLLAKGRARES